MPMIKSRLQRIASIDQTIGSALPKHTLQHYGTAAHKSWSASVLKRAGYRCEAINPDGRRCACRGRLYADHIIEVADNRALALDLANGQALCAHHHGLKTAQARAERQGGARASRGT